MSNDEELRWVRRQPGTQRPNSRHTPGYERDLLYEEESGELRGPTESRSANIEDIVREHSPITSTAPSLGDLARFHFADIALRSLDPYIRRFVDWGVDATVEKVRDLVSWSMLKAAKHSNAGRKPFADDPATTSDAENEQSAGLHDSDETERQDNPEMSGEEYRARLLSALTAERHAEQQKQLLRNVNVSDEALPADVREAIHLALSTPAPALDEDTLALVVSFLATSSIANVDFVLAQAADRWRDEDVESGR